MSLFVSVLVSVVSIALAAFLAFVFGRLGARTDAEMDHDKWLRERRFEAYNHFLATADKWATRAKGPDAPESGEPGQEFYDEMTTAEAAVDLIGPDAVMETMDPIRSAILHLQDVDEAASRAAATDYWNKERAFVEAAREELFRTPTSKRHKPRDNHQR